MPIQTIEEWFDSRCNGMWEHDYGFTLETTDNPGWWATIDQAIDPDLLGRLSFKLGRLPFKDQGRNAEKTLNDAVFEIWSSSSANAEIMLDGVVFKVWSSSLYDCLQAVAMILSSLEEDRSESN